MTYKLKILTLFIVKHLSNKAIIQSNYKITNHVLIIAILQKKNNTQPTKKGCKQLYYLHPFNYFLNSLTCL